ncbi:DUF6311 domain-containing protein [Dokdonella ginsengisoli]|uniref:DUF6311 domain-containing protein n=1 Tax=Dokdonella ginsengisoli TaxID=363846 RepID=A0ABV9QRU3_9GAMM
MERTTSSDLRRGDRGPAPVRTTQAWWIEAVVYASVCALLLFDALHLLDRVAAAGAAVPGLAPDRALILVAVLALLGFGTVSARRQEVDRPLAFGIGAACGLIFFARTLGTALADPTAIGWLLGADLAQHYSGWAMFRDAPWHWPPGLMPELWYPVGTSIAYTDSLPLLALLLKPLSPWLPQPFQYIGLWLMGNCVLQGGVAALLLTRTTRRPAAILAGAMLFVSAPLLISRLGHDTLTTQWLLLLSLWFYFRTDPPVRLAAEMRPWLLIAGAAILVHPYLASMAVAIQVAYWIRRVSIDRARTPRDAAIALGVTLAVLVALLWFSGAMVIRSADSAGGVAYGRYSFNLLGFFNPMGHSRLLPTLPSLPEQYEGFAFPGLGVLALGLWLLVDAVLRRRPPRLEPSWRPLALVAFALCLFAASSVTAIGSLVLLDRPIDSPLFGPFRASGRFVWIAYYALILLVVSSAIRRYRPAAAASLLALALTAQLADLSPTHLHYAKTRLRANAEVPGTRLGDARWAALAEGRRHLTLLPPAACGEAAGPYLPFQLFAAQHRLTLNTGYLARWNDRATQDYCGDLASRSDAGLWSPDDIYVIGPDRRWKERFERTPPPFSCEKLDGYDACVVDEAKTLASSPPAG